MGLSGFEMKAAGTLCSSITQIELCALLHDLGFRARVTGPSIIESASGGMVWKIELTPVPSTTAIRFSADLVVAADPIDSVNDFNCGKWLIVAACKPGYDPGLTWLIEFSMLRVLEGGVAPAHVVSWIESWVAGLEAAVANFFDFY
jgi:hypothetical protein